MTSQFIKIGSLEDLFKVIADHVAASCDCEACQAGAADAKAESNASAPNLSEIKEPGVYWYRRASNCEWEVRTMERMEGAPGVAIWSGPVLPFCELVGPLVPPAIVGARGSIALCVSQSEIDLAFLRALERAVSTYPQPIGIGQRVATEFKAGIAEYTKPAGPKE